VYVVDPAAVAGLNPTYPDVEPDSRSVPLTSSVDAGALVLMPTLPPVNSAEYVALENVCVPAHELVAATAAANVVFPLKVDQSAALKAPRFAAEAVGMFNVMTGVVVPVATVELTSVPVVPNDSAETLLTVPPPVPDAAAVIRPFASTVMFAAVYDPATTAVLARVKAIVVVPDPVASPLIPID
jgi:hypothetical protein